MKKETKYVVLAGLFIALGLVLPFFTAQIPAIGRKLLPMHIPVLISGFVCGWPSGLIVGLVTPVLRSLLLGMPPMFPTAVAMCFELATYGFLTGYFYEMLPKKNSSIFVTLIGSMLGGRIVWGLVSLVLYGISGVPFTWQIFLAGAFIDAMPGIIAQILLIPALVSALMRANYSGK